MRTMSYSDSRVNYAEPLKSAANDPQEAQSLGFIRGVKGSRGKATSRIRNAVLGPWERTHAQLVTDIDSKSVRYTAQ